MYNYFAHLKLKNSNNVSLGFYQQSNVQVDRICLPSCTNVKVSIRYKQKGAKSETFSIYMKNCTNSSYYKHLIPPPFSGVALFGFR
jgi:hypothetical protein